MPLFEILQYEETALGLLCLRRRELLSRPGTVVTEVVLDEVFLMSSYHTESERALASLALAMHEGGADLDVLVGGLGLGFTAGEALRDERVRSVEVVEFLPEVIRWLDKGWIPDSEALRRDVRLRITEGDVYANLVTPASTGRTFDLILIDVDHAPDEMLVAANAPFYTLDGLGNVRDHLRPGGVLAVWSTFPSSEFSVLLESVFEHVKVETISWWNDLIDEQKEDTLFFARRGAD